jgi:hypothetical protein
MDFTDKWEYDNGMKAILMCKENKGHHLYLLSQKGNQLTMRAGILGDIYVFEM